MIGSVMPACRIASLTFFATLLVAAFVLPASADTLTLTPNLTVKTPGANKKNPGADLRVSDLQTEVPHCTPPAVYSKKQKRCVVPEKRPDTVVCVHPKVYSQKQRRCVTPEPRVVQCRLPEVYSFKLGRCYVPTPRVVICAPPAVFSARLGRCIVPEPQVVVCRPPTIYSPKLGRCYVPEPKQASCNFPYVASGPTCVCASGYVSSAGRCVRRSTTPSVVIDVGRIQECLTRLGYDPGSIDGVQGRATRNAFREFQMANGMAARPASLSDAQTQGLLYEQCAAPPIEEASPDAPPPTEVASPATLPQRCLPQDLYDLMKSAYGKDPALPACTPQTGYCLPKPLFYSEAKLAVGLGQRRDQMVRSVHHLEYLAAARNHLQDRIGRQRDFVRRPAGALLPARPPGRPDADRDPHHLQGPAD